MALASGANAFGFPARFVNRTRDKKAYGRRGILDFPDSGGFWYTDGGTLDNEPFGHTLELAGALDQVGGDFERLHLLIHPNATPIPTGPGWTDPRANPTWLGTLERCATTLLMSQKLYDDLRQAQKNNTRLAWLDQLLDGLRPVLGAYSSSDRAAFVRALERVFTAMEDERQGLPGSRRPRPQPGDDPEQLLRAVVEDIAGLGGKRPAEVDIISPDLLGQADRVGVTNMLAGDPFGNFGGFFDGRLRESDFQLGYSCTLAWIEQGGLTAHGISRADSDLAFDAANNFPLAQPPLWEKWGTTSAGWIVRHHPFTMLHLGLRAGWVTLRDLVTAGSHEQG